LPLECLNEVLQQVKTGFFNTKITTPNLPNKFMVAVKKAVWEVCTWHDILVLFVLHFLILIQMIVGRSL
jgi:hypothetical protein